MFRRIFTQAYKRTAPRAQAVAMRSAPQTVRPYSSTNKENGLHLKNQSTEDNYNSQNHQNQHWQQEMFFKTLIGAYEGFPQHQIPDRQVLLQEVRAVLDLIASPLDTPEKAGNIEFLAYVAAVYRIVKADNQAPISKLIVLLQTAIEDLFPFITQSTRDQLNSSKDPFTTLVRYSKDLETTTYSEPDFTTSRPKDTSNSYHLEIHRCWYVSMLRKVDAQEIAPVFCHFDKLWIQAIDEKRHGVQFIRPSTIATGADRCRFYFDRKG